MRESGDGVGAALLVAADGDETETTSVELTWIEHATSRVRF